MIEFNGMILDLPTVEIEAPARPHFAARRRSFYQQHKLAIWAIVDLLLFAGFMLAWSGNADIIWRLSTPLIRWVP